MYQPLFVNKQNANVSNITSISKHFNIEFRRVWKLWSLKEQFMLYITVKIRKYYHFWHWKSLKNNIERRWVLRVNSILMGCRKTAIHNAITNYRANGSYSIGNKYQCPRKITLEMITLSNLSFTCKIIRDFLLPRKRGIRMSLADWSMHFS